MYNNLLNITIEDKKLVDILNSDLSWQDKDIFYRFLNHCIPLLIFEIIPNGDNIFLIKWKSQNDFNNILIDETYLRIIDVLGKYKIKIIWNDDFATVVPGQ